MRKFAFSVILALAPLCNLHAQGLPFPGPGMVHSTGGSTISVIAHGCDALGPSGGTSSAYNLTGANKIILVVSQYNGVATATPTDSSSNTWTKVVEQGTGALQGASIQWVSNSPTVTSSQTFSVTGSNVFASVCVLALSGANTASNVDQTNGAGSNPSSVTTIQPGSITPTTNNQIVVAAVCPADDRTGLAIDSGFGAIDSAGIVGTAEAAGMSWIIQTTATAKNPTWTWTNAGVAAATIASYK